MSKIEVNAIEPQCGTTLTIGASDTSIAGIGTVNWDTTAKTAAFTAVSGRGYFVNTTSGAITVTLPAGSAGSIVSLKDYANTWDTNNVTVTPDGTDKINGVNSNSILDTEDQSVTLVYVDSTKGWRAVQDSTSSVDGAQFIVATGGCVTCCGDFKIHTFTGPGTFTVTCAGNPAGSNTVDYLVVAGGGGGSGGPSGDGGGGGGAGGYRESSGSASGCYTTSPLGTCVSALPVTAQGYPITVGAGGSGTDVFNTPGCNGSNSVFSTITSTGGGAGGGNEPGENGGSGGGGGAGGNGPYPGGSGNTPPVSPPQGNNGGGGGTNGTPGSDQRGGGGGGATAAGQNSQPSDKGGDGGAGGTTNITGSPVAYAGGGGGMSAPGNTSQDGAGGVGGGGAGGYGCGSAVAGTANTGGGGGGAGNSGGPTTAGGSGGSGIVIIRYKYQ